MDKYASHLPVLEILFSFVDIRHVFEYGCGFYSTKFFIDRAKSVTSVEMQDEKWYDTVKTSLISEKLNLVLALNPQDAIAYFDNSSQKYDLVFVDGIYREDCVRHAFGKTDIIAVHDIGRKAMRKGWRKISVPKDYKAIIMEGLHPNTTVYTSNSNLFEILKKCTSVVIKDN